MRWPRKSGIHIQGLAIGIECGEERYVEGLAERCLRKGLLAAPEGDTLLLIPALNIDPDTARKGLDILEECV